MIRLLWGAALGMALLGCGSTTGTSLPTGTHATTAAPATAVVTTPAPPTATSPPQLAEGEPCALEPADGPGDACEMPPGEYHSTQWGAGVAFELAGDGWLNVVNESDVLAVFALDGRWISFQSGAPVGSSGPLTGPEDTQAMLGFDPSLAITPRRASPEIGGIEAEVFDIANIGESVGVLWQAPVSGDAYFLTPDTSVRVYWLTVRDTPTLVLLEAPTQGFEAYLEDMQPFLGSIAWD